MSVQIRGDTRLDEIDGNTIKSLLMANQDEDIFFDFKEGVDSDSREINMPSARLWHHLPIRRVDSCSWASLTRVMGK